MKLRFYGHIGSMTGYGRAGGDLVLALRTAGVDVEIRPLDKPESLIWDGPHAQLRDLARRDSELDPAPDAVIVHTLPMDCMRVLDIVNQEGPSLYDGPPLIAYTTWETDNAPAEVSRALAAFDQVWVPSPRTAAALRRSEVDLAMPLVVPHCFDPAVDRSGVPYSPVMRPFRFYYVGGWNARKNPAGVVRAFCWAFERGDDVELVLHVPGTVPDRLRAAIAMCGIPKEVHPKISASIMYKTEKELLAFHANEVDCFVSASHGEAWNLPAFEAMLAGRHVICPARQGSDYFLENTSADLYESTRSIATCDVTHLPDGTFDVVKPQGLDGRETWQEPDLIRLGHHMRRCANTKTRTIHLEYDPAEIFSFAAVGELAKSYLEKA
jgi:glycosyltransferase involved in cell wall biosynthesis